jgi:hypothetical protein
MTSQEVFQYSPLTAPDAMRLVVIEPSFDLEAPLHAAIVHTTLRERENDIVEHYVALSYVWGDQTDRSTISISGRSLDIMSSLEEALRHIREPRRPLYVWADGICIDQKMWRRGTSRSVKLALFMRMRCIPSSS